MIQIKENGEKRFNVEAGGQFTIWKQGSLKTVDWNYTDGKWRDRNGKYSNSYGGT